ncbi:MAG: hypothetical protein GYA59_09475 [Chloroflexi bacterium]|nr:hypothetical protein [Chloroflexota bacterium]
MLYEKPLMEDIDVDHWRNMQSLLLESAKGKRRIIAIHENGKIVKFVHSDRVEIQKVTDRVDNPAVFARQVYEANPGKADFVMVLERHAVDQYFAEVQDSWKAEEDLDEYVHRMFARLDDYPDGIVTYPQKARETLGLQWRFGAAYEDVKAVVENLLPVESSLILGIFNNGKLWGTLVLVIDENKRIADITTADPTELTGPSSWEDASKELVQWVNRKFLPCSLGLFTDLEGARTFIAEKDKLGALRKLRGERRLLVEPAPEVLKKML